LEALLLALMPNIYLDAAIINLSIYLRFPVRRQEVSEGSIAFLTVCFEGMKCLGNFDFDFCAATRLGFG